MKRPFPPFVNDDFAIEVLLALGGSASRGQITQYVDSNFGETKHGLQYLFSQYGQLRKAGYVDTKYDIRKKRDALSYSIKDEVKHLIKVPQVAKV